MAQASYEIYAKGQGKSVSNLKKYVVLKATVSLDDTITVSQLSSIDGVKILSLVDGAEVACTEVDNVITITEDPCANVQVVVMVIGS